MFDSTALRLLEGKFICEITAPEEYRWLVQKKRSDGEDKVKSNSDEISEYLDKVGRTLTSTTQGLAYYAATKKIAAKDKEAVKAQFTLVKQRIQPVVRFLTFCMSVEKKDMVPQAGDCLDYPALLKAITAENGYLLEQLQQFSAISRDFVTADTSAGGMLMKVLQQMVNWDCLVLDNAAQQRYRLTGVLDYYTQVIDFLVENEEMLASTIKAEQEEEKQQQQDLFHEPV